MIFDSFLFFNELDLLMIRLEHLRDVVDHFVLVEATHTHSGVRKPLYFERYRHLFSAYHDRITHHVVCDIPRFARTSRYLREYHHRDAIGAALVRAGCSPDDVVLVSDVDEIPSVESVAEALALLESNDLVVFEQAYHQYYVNRVLEHSWLGTVACRYRFLCTLGSVQTLRVGEQRNARRSGVVTSKTTIERKYPRIAKGGWHLSWLGGPEAVLYKQQSYSHTQRDPTPRQRLRYVRFNTGRSRLVENPGRRGPTDAPVRRNFDVDCELPPYLVENRDLFAHFFEPVNRREDLDHTTEWYGANYSMHRRVYGRVELVIEGIRRMLWSRFPRLIAAMKRLIHVR